MWTRLSFESGLLRAAVLLVFFACLVGVGQLYSQAAPNECQANGVFAETAGDSLPFKSPDSILTGRTEIGVPDEFEVAVEDEASIEMFRVDIQQRVFGLDRPVIRPEVTTQVALSSYPKSSPPLLE